jgi:hypothetical protein
MTNGCSATRYFSYFLKGATNYWYGRGMSWTALCDWAGQMGQTTLVRHRAGVLLVILQQWSVVP